MEAWQQTLLSSLVVAVATWLLSRRMYAASVGEKEASTSKILQGLAASLARQLKAYEDEMPSWKQKVADLEKKAKGAEESMAKVAIVKKEVDTIADHISHLGYFADPDEIDGPVAKRFRAVKDAAKRINAIEWD